MALTLASALIAGCGPGPREPLLLLLTVDTLRADHIGAYGGPEGLTPSLDALIAKSLRFDAAYSTCSYTLPSMSALMTGRHPEEVGMLTNVSLLRGASVTLAGLLGLEGWRSGAVVSNYVLRETSGIDRGFDFFDATFETRERNREMPERLAAPTTDAALAMIDVLAEARDKGTAGVFLWVHYQDPHGPYTPPDGLRERYLEEARRDPAGNPTLEAGTHLGIGSIPDYQYVDGQHEVAYYRAGYRGEIAYLDAEVGRLLDGLRERGWLDDAVVVFTTDHGEGMGEDDYWFAHGEYLSDPLVRVPLSIRLPDRPGGVRSDLASHVDLFPTILSWLGSSTPSDYPGRDLLAAGAEEASPELYLASLRGSTVPRFAVVNPEFKYVSTWRGGEPVEERLHPFGDESSDLSAERPHELERMRERLREMRRALRVPAAQSRQQLSDEDRKRLRALGYVIEE